MPLTSNQTILLVVSRRSLDPEAKQLQRSSIHSSALQRNLGSWLCVLLPEALADPYKLLSSSWLSTLNSPRKCKEVLQVSSTPKAGYVYLIRWMTRLDVSPCRRTITKDYRFMVLLRRDVRSGHANRQPSLNPFGSLASDGIFLSRHAMWPRWELLS